VPSLNQKFKQLDNTGELMKYPVYMSNIIRRLNTWHSDAVNTMHKAQVAQQNYTKKRSNKLDFNEGDYVTMREQKGFRKTKFQGKFKIMRKIGETLFEIQNCIDPEQKKIVHVSKIKKCVERFPHLTENAHKNEENTPTNPKHDYNLRSSGENRKNN